MLLRCARREGSVWIETLGVSLYRSAASSFALLLFSTRATRCVRAFAQSAGSFPSRTRPTYGAANLVATSILFSARNSAQTIMAGCSDDHGVALTSSNSRQSSLSDFLARSSAEARRIASTPGSNDVVHAFAGNEACDADSICSALCMAFLRGEEERYGSAFGVNAGAGQRREGTVVALPVVPIPRADMALRGEVLVLFDLCGVDPMLVTFIDEIDLSSLQAQGRLRLTLVDHNAVSGPLSGLGDAVVEIVDHHKDQTEHAHVQGSARDIAFDAALGNGKPLVGSCCTMVAERLMKHRPTLLSSDVARLLLGVILIDTVNLDAEAKRATPRDIQAAQELSRRISWIPPPASLLVVTGRQNTTAADNVARATGDSEHEQKSDCDYGAEGDGDPRTSSDVLFETLRDAKFDPAFWRELSAEDCLRYDYKQFTPAGSSGRRRRPEDEEEPATCATMAFGMSSVLCRLETLAEKEGVTEALIAFAEKRRLDSLIVMTCTFDQTGGGAETTMRRELLIFVARNDRQRFQDMKAFLEGPQGEFLSLRESDSFSGVAGRGKNDGDDRFYVAQWELGNTRPSRKQVAPAIMTFYETLVID